MAEATPGIRARQAADDPHAWEIVIDDRASDARPMRAFGALDADGRAWIWIDGDVVLVAPPAPPQARGGRPAPTDMLTSPMPATVVSVHVAAGDRVAAGDILVLLEAMKMEMPLRAPHDGIVTDVACAPGALVQPGTALVTLEEVSDDGA